MSFCAKIDDSGRLNPADPRATFTIAPKDRQGL